MLKSNLQKANITRKEIRHELRQSNVTKFTQIKAVVLESNGEISVLHHADEHHNIDKLLLLDVDKGSYA